MTKNISSPGSNILIPTIEEVRRISDAERQALRADLDQARADIVAGNFDVVTSETLAAEFDEIFHGDKADDELGAQLTRRSAS